MVGCIVHFELVKLTLFVVACYCIVGCGVAYWWCLDVDCDSAV